VCVSRVRDPTKGNFLIEAAPDSFAAKQHEVFNFIKTKAFVDMVTGAADKTIRLPDTEVQESIEVRLYKNVCVCVCVRVHLGSRVSVASG
jgi:hypothetical protein